MGFEAALKEQAREVRMVPHLNETPAVECGCFLLTPNWSLSSLW